MSTSTSGSGAPWPPPPDLASIQELVRAADLEGHIADGSPTDEYEPEEEAIFALLCKLPTDRLRVEVVMPMLEQVWRNSFACDDRALARRRPALLALAQQIERFFGPEATPQTRGTA